MEEGKDKKNHPPYDKLKHDLELYKMALDSQMHFNELLIKMRTTVISIILAVFGAATISLKDLTLYAQILGRKVHISIVILVIGLIFLACQWLIDFFYYYKLLLGSVKFTEKIDKNYEKFGFFGLTTSIIKSVSPTSAGVILCIYYSIPLILGALTIYIIYFKLVAK